MVTICCDRSECGYNQCFSCTCSHIHVGMNGCRSFILAEELNKKEVEVWCQPNELQNPIVLICRSNVVPIANDLKGRGFTWEKKPLCGIVTYRIKPEPVKNVWVYRTDFNNLDIVRKDMEEFGYEFVDYVTESEKEFFKYKKKYDGITQEVKNKLLREMAPPQMPNTVAKGHWNGIIYGSPGKETVWVDGQKINLKPHETDEIRKYILDKKNYEKEFVFLNA